MSFLSGLRARFRALLHPAATEADLDDEIRFHIEKETEKNLQSGMSPEEALRRARVAFGGTERVREAHREARGNGWLQDALADARFGLRSLRRNPVLAATAILTLALGVGANTAIFSVVDTVILRPLPFPAPGRLMKLSEDNQEKGWHRTTAAPANFFDWKERVHAFQDAAAYTPGGHVTLTGQGDALMLHNANVTGRFFSVLGVPPALGRGFTPEETWANGTHVAVISDRLWRTRFGADPSLIGRTIQLDGVATQVIGVTRPGFAFPAEDIDVWSPFEWDPAFRGQTWFRRAHWLWVVARLAPGATVASAGAEFQAVVRQLQTEYPETNRTMGADLMPLHDFLIGSVRTPLFVLLGAVVLLLLIACANVGNLLLVQALGRERESALRLTLGAGRGRLVRQALTESLVLSLIGGAAGCLLGWAGTRALGSLQPGGLLPVRQVPVNGSVLAYVLAISTASGLLFGIAPALWRGRRQPAEVLREGRRGGENRRLHRWGNVLVVAEISLALLLTVGAGLLVRSFWRLQQVNPGFDSHHVLVAALNLPPEPYDTTTKIAAFYQDFAARVRALPGVSAAATVLLPPLSPGGWTSDYHIAGRPADQYGVEVLHRQASPDYFKVMRVPLIAGRLLNDQDRANTTPVVLINRALAEKEFPQENPVGQRITFDRIPGPSSTWRTIVGVVGSERQHAIASPPRIEVFEPAAQNPNSYMTLVARTTGDPGLLEPAVRRVLKSLDPHLALAVLTTMDQMRSASVARQRFIMILLFTFAGVGLTLALVGVYGVVAQLSRRRNREMGIRLALGARSGEVEWLVVRQGLRIVGLGLAAGIGAALLVTRALRSLLYGVSAIDPATFLTVAALLTLTAVSASWVPAWRAGRTDPARVLRED